MTQRLGLSHALRGLAVIPIVAGLASMLLGAGAVQAGGDPNASVSSELRYYGAFYAGFGVYLWSLAPRVAQRGRELRAAAAILFCGGLARALGVVVDGAPAPGYVALMVVELAVPVVLVLWHRRTLAHA